MSLLITVMAVITLYKFNAKKEHFYVEHYRRTAELLLLAQKVRGNIKAIGSSPKGPIQVETLRLPLPAAPSRGGNEDDARSKASNSASCQCCNDKGR